MLTRWHLNRFKSFTSELDLELRPITVLTGPNSSGKSSVIQSMLLLAQALTENHSENFFLLNGALIASGTAEDIISKNQPEHSFSIGCNISHCRIEEFNAQCCERANVMSVQDPDFSSAREDDKNLTIAPGYLPFPDAKNLIMKGLPISEDHPHLESGRAFDAIPFQSQLRISLSTTEESPGEASRKLQFMPRLDSFLLRAISSQLGEGKLYEWNVISDVDKYDKLRKWIKHKDLIVEKEDSTAEALRYSVIRGGLPVEYFIWDNPQAFSVHAKIIGLSFAGLLPDKYCIGFDELDRKIDILFDVLGIPGGMASFDEVFATADSRKTNLAMYQASKMQYENDEELNSDSFILCHNWLARKPFLRAETEEMAVEMRKSFRYQLLESHYNDVTHPEFLLDTSGPFRTVLVEMLKEIADKAEDERASNIIYFGISQIEANGSIKNILDVFNDFYEKDKRGGKHDRNRLLGRIDLLMLNDDYESDPNGWNYFTPEIELALVKYSKKLREALKEGHTPRPVVRHVQIAPDSLWRKIGTDVADYFRNSFQYVGPLREDPKPLYPIGKSGNRKDVGTKGEQVAHVLHLFGHESIEYISAHALDEIGKKPLSKRIQLIDAVNEWLTYLGVADRIDPGDPGKLGYALKIMPKAQKFALDLTQVGVGASQVLPILTAGLIANPGTTLVFEQPELHLHPRVQSRLADFFVALMLCGKQVIVETHSEYIINRLRYRSVVAEGNSVASQVGILFFENESGTTNVRNVQMNEYGYIGEWPKGFFDEGDELAAAILQAGMLKRKLSVLQMTNNE